MAFVSPTSGFAKKFFNIGLRVAHPLGEPSSSQEMLSSLAWRQTAVIVAAAVLAKLIYIDIIIGHSQALLPYLWPAFLLAFIQHFFFKALRLQETEVLLAPTIGFGVIIGGLILSFLVLIGLFYLTKMISFYSRGWFLSWAVISSVGLIAVQWASMRQARSLAARGKLRKRVVLFGTPDYITSIKTSRLDKCSDSKVVGMYCGSGGDEKALHQALGELQSAVERDAYDQILIAAPATEAALIRLAVKRLSACTKEVLLCTELEQPLVPTCSLRSLGGLRVGVVNAIPQSEQNRVLKRSLDYLIAGCGVLLLSPVFALVALLIKLDSPGDVLFRQRRYGQNNRVFTIYKFRTMTVTEDGEHVKQAERGDPRVTRVGRFLRASSIDELPQLFNVLQGSMAMIGPRPHAIVHDLEFEKSLDLFARRRRVLPGLTGWAQVNGYRGETKTVEDVRRRMELDLYYIENWSIWLDIEILARTVITVLRGAY